MYKTYLFKMCFFLAKQPNVYMEFGYYGIILTLYSIDTPLNAFVADDYWKHCGNGAFTHDEQMLDFHVFKANQNLCFPFS